MGKKFIILIILSILLFPQIAFANFLYIPDTIIVVSPILFAIEFAFIYIYFNKILKLKIEYWQIMIAISIAKLISILPFYGISEFIEENLGVLGVLIIGLLFFILIDFAVYIPLFRKNKIDNITLFGASVFANLTSLILIILIVVFLAGI